LYLFSFFETKKETREKLVTISVVAL